MNASSDLSFDFSPDLPVAISLVGGRYLLFDVKIVTWLRREHRICGTALGTLPIAPSQNLFLGVPIEIMPEEAELLVERNIAVIADDARAHAQAVRSGDQARRADYLARIEKQSNQVKQAKDQEKMESKRRGLEKQSKKSAHPSRSTQVDPANDLLDFDEAVTPHGGAEEVQAADEEVVVQDVSPVKVLPLTATSSSYRVTPATSRLLLPHPLSAPQSTIEDLPPSYPLYRHLHDKGFFMTPGLRFGCQYTVYPGDPLRFHSHFLAIGTEWDEEIDLMDIVGGGRLGTGVKKGFLLGGANPTGGGVRTFSVEWAAM
ncbi:tRNA-intron endonuclease [Cladophialophora carrionii CBS 160.54]|uniref:tRNA-splicing endonuclease subunit Sen34 n=1 Tax=Cladophialophora carrionii CBS 160.54 TaxID=1279043 RepID=V9D3D6_9EURO|nr:tRNA-intron endonuclease [Cladophialophora carrionii CBS 160.54]ETI21399.1 tRNA-intron endonuclease [Cladophialophora carrionii CBS 160.54]